MTLADNESESDLPKTHSISLMFFVWFEEENKGVVGKEDFEG